jgi:hypothetical protein
MKISEITEQMCRTELADADIKAICKSRGFSLSNARSPAVLESMLLSDVGLPSAFAGLERKEIIMLHFLKCREKPVDISVFEPLAEKGISRFGTFNQKYADLFKRIKLRLIRRGILVCASDPSRHDAKTKLERQVFGFPTQFHAELPSLFTSPAKLPGGGELNEPVIRAKLHQLTQPLPADASDRFAWGFSDGVLLMGADEFVTDTFSQWQKHRWASADGSSLFYDYSARARVSPMDAMNYAFSTLGSDEWIEPEEMGPIFKIFCRKGSKLNARQVLHQGWENACLVRQKENGKTWYRSAPSFADISALSRYGDFLDADETGRIKVNLDTVPLRCLEAISQVSRFSVEDGVLTAFPDIIRMGRRHNAIGKSSLRKWLAETSNAFSKAFSTASQRWGRHLVHRNLLIAKVKNIGLKVSLEKTFKNGKVIFLPGDFIAFPESLLGQVESLVIQNGFAVKTIDQST